MVDYTAPTESNCFARRRITEVERVILDRAMPPNQQGDPRDLAFYMTAIACLGGYLDRKSDPPPGTTVIWRGLSRLADITEGFIVANENAIKTCG